MIVCMQTGPVARALRLGALAALAVALSACAGFGRSERPAAVEERGTPPPAAATPGSDVQIAAYTPPAQPRYVRPEPRRAVEVLVRKAEGQRLDGDLDGAVASLERALRIAPDDALLWNELAHVRKAQGRSDLVAELAAKSNALAHAQDGALRGDNWRLIADARRALGDAAGARAAENRAAEYR